MLLCWNRKWRRLCSLLLKSILITYELKVHCRSQKSLLLRHSDLMRKWKIFIFALSPLKILYKKRILFAKFTSDKKDDFWFTFFKTFSDEKKGIFVIFKCEEKAIFKKSYSKLLLNYNVIFPNISPSFSHAKLVKIAFFITDKFSQCHPLSCNEIK